MQNNHAVTCPVCAEPAPLLRAGYAGYRAPDRYDIHACDKCDLQFASPFQANSSIYEAIYRQPERVSGYSRYFDYKRAVLGAADPLAHLANSESVYWFIAEAAAQFNPDRESKILEVGCGLGYLTYALRQARHDVKGVDLSEAAIASARASFGDHYLSADVNALPATAAASFDIIVMTEVLEHLEFPLQVLRSLHALLRPGGVALVSTPSKDFLPQGAVWRTDNPPVHLAWYSATSLREMARRTNFRVRFADFSRFNQARVAEIGKPRDLSIGSGEFRLSKDGEALDRLAEPSQPKLIDQIAGWRRIARRRKYVRRALELYAAQSEVLGVILERPD